MAERDPARDKSSAEAFSPYEKMPTDTNGWTSRHLDAIKHWVALEKIHGANFSFAVTAASGEIGPARAAKRSGYLINGENFFGLKKNPGLVEEEGEKTRRLFRAVRDGHCTDVSSVIVFGELFGGSYPHPDVPKAPNAVSIQREVVYCPENRFIAYDVAVTLTNGSREFLDYDVCLQLFSGAGFLHCEPLKTGSLADMLSLELGFETKLPAKLGLPPLRDRKNTAEGVVIKPLKNTVLGTKKGPQRVIFKRKIENFQERKKPRFSDAKSQQKKERGKGGKDHELKAKAELLKYEMSALVSEQRLVNTISKRGIPDSESEWTELTEALMADVMESAEVENEEAWLACGGPSQETVESVREECRQLVDMYRIQESMTNTKI